MSPPLLDLFRQACGIAGPLELEVIALGQETAELQTFEQPFALVGQDPHTDICLQAGVVRRHAYLQLIAGRLFFVRLDRRKGVPEEARPKPLGWLDPGRALRVENSAIRVRAHVNGEAPPVEPPSLDWNPIGGLPTDQPLTPGVTLEITGGLTGAIRWRMDRVMSLVGRAPGCKLKLTDISVSGFHCSLLHTPLGVWVIDLISRQGTLLNGEMVRWARLANGDRLQIGRFLIQPWYEEAGSSPTPFPAMSLPAGPDRLWGPPATPPGPGAGQLVAANAVAPAGAADGLLLPVVQQFNLMQQQMFDQFHHTMAMMVQMFSTLHRDQMSLIREELDKMHQLTAELQSLQAELKRHGPTAPAPPSPVPAAPTPAAVPPRPQAAEVRPQAPAPPAANGPSVPPPRPPVVPAGKQSASADVHLWLHQRIATLQEERQTRWQKILNFVTGKSSAE